MSDRIELAIRELAEALREELRAEAVADPRAPDKLYTIPEACKALGGLSRSTLYGLIGSGELKSLAVGRRRFITSASVAAFIANRERAA